MFTKVLIPLDGSSAAEAILPLAGHMVEMLKLPVELLAIVDVKEMLTSAERARHFEKLLEDETRGSEKYLKKIAARFTNGQVECSIDKGLPAEMIITRAEAVADTLIAMATHGRSGLNRWLLGSVAEKVLRGSKMPLLLARAGLPQSAAAGPLQNIIVPLDGSGLAEQILPMVSELALRLKAAVILFRACEMPSPVYSGGHGFHSVKAFEDLGVANAAAQDYLHEQAEAMRKAGVATVACVSREGLSADEIISIAQHTANSLIAMSSHGRSGPGRWFLGSVAETVARHANCPVLVFRPPQVTRWAEGLSI